MTIERTLARHYRLRDTAELLKWSPAVVMGLLIAVGLHIYDRPRVVDARLERTFDLFFYAFVASPAGTVLGFVLAHLRARAASRWLGGELSFRASPAAPVFPRRLGGYSIKKVFSHREAGVRLTRFRLIKPFRFTVNSALSAFWIFLTFEFIAVLNRAPIVGSKVTPGGFATASAIMMVFTIALLIWVNYRWVIDISLVDNQTRLQMSEMSGPIRRRQFESVLIPGRPTVRLTGAAVFIVADKRELCLSEFSPGPLGVWEAKQLAAVISSAMGLGFAASARSSAVRA